MSNLIELKVPDIGGHNNVDVIEVFVKPGDVIEKEASLITLETDKATMEVPAEAAGTVKEVRVAVGGKVSEGDVVVILEAAGAAAAAPAEVKPVETTGVASATTQAGFAPQAAPVAASHSGGADVECDVMVLGGGPGGYSAAFRAADLA